MWLLKPNCTHVTQPLDLSFFGPMKKYIEKYAVAWQHKNPGQNLTKYTLVSEAAHPAFEKCLTSSRSTVISGWKQSGIYPWCPENVNMKKLNPSKIYETAPSDVSPAAQSTPAVAAPDDNLGGRMMNDWVDNSGAGMVSRQDMMRGLEMGPGDMNMGERNQDDPEKEALRRKLQEMEEQMKMIKSQLGNQTSQAREDVTRNDLMGSRENVNDNFQVFTDP